MERTEVSLGQRIFFPGDWGTPRDRRNWLRFVGMCSVSGLCWVLVTYLIRAGYLAVGVPALVGTLFPALLCLGAMAAYFRFLRETDELQRRVQVNGLALGFGAGVFWAVLTAMLAQAGATMPACPGILAIIVGAYGIGVSVAAHRHGAIA